MGLVKHEKLLCIQQNSGKRDVFQGGEAVIVGAMEIDNEENKTAVESMFSEATGIGWGWAGMGGNANISPEYLTFEQP